MQPEGERRPEIPIGDVLGDVPLFREIQRVLLSSTGPINWELARQVGTAVASWGTDDPAPVDADREAFEQTVRAAELSVADFTGIAPPAAIARVEVVRRARWVETTIAALRDVLEPVAAKLTSVLRSAHPGASILGGEEPLPGMHEAQGIQGMEMMGALMDRLVPLMVGAQVGMGLGHLGQRVFGQYDLPVPRVGSELTFVTANITRFERDWSLPPVEFRAWVALHEVIHRFEFARPWIRERFIELVRDVVDHAEIDVAAIERQVEALDLSNPEALGEAFGELADVFGSSSDPDQRLRIARVQAFIAVAEGYGEHVKDRLGRRMLSEYGRIDEAVRRHLDDETQRSLERLVGIETTAEHHRLGREFCAKVSELSDEATLALMWESGDALPSMPELEEPTLWLTRMT